MSQAFAMGVINFLHVADFVGRQGPSWKRNRLQIYRNHLIRIASTRGKTLPDKTWYPDNSHVQRTFTNLTSLQLQYRDLNSKPSEPCGATRGSARDLVILRNATYTQLCPPGCLSERCLRLDLKGVHTLCRSENL